MLHAVLNKFKKYHSTKKSTERPLTSHHTNHQITTNKTCGSLLEKLGHIHKRRSLMDHYTSTHKCWLIVMTYSHQWLCLDTGCCLDDQPGVMNDRDSQRESLGNPWWWWWWWWWWCGYLFFISKIFSLVLMFLLSPFFFPFNCFISCDNFTLLFIDLNYLPLFFSTASLLMLISLPFS